MEITFRYSGQLALTAGISSETLAIEPGTTLAAAVRPVASSHGEKFSELVFDPEGEIRPTLLLAVDGVQVRDARSPIAEGVREVLLMTPMAGG